MEIRQNPRINMQPDEWGVDISSTIVDSIRDVLIQRCQELGFKERDFSSRERVREISPSNPMFDLLGAVGGEAAREAAKRSIDAKAFYRIDELPRKEPILIDDGGTIVHGHKAGDFDSVLKIAVRGWEGENVDTNDLVEEILIQNGIDPIEAAFGSCGEDGTLVYALKRVSDLG